MSCSRHSSGASLEMMPHSDRVGPSRVQWTLPHSSCQSWKWRWPCVPTLWVLQVVLTSRRAAHQGHRQSTIQSQGPAAAQSSQVPYSKRLAGKECHLHPALDETPGHTLGLLLYNGDREAYTWHQGDIIGHLLVPCPNFTAYTSAVARVRHGNQKLTPLRDEGLVTASVSYLDQQRCSARPRGPWAGL